MSTSSSIQEQLAKLRSSLESAPAATAQPVAPTPQPAPVAPVRSSLTLSPPQNPLQKYKKFIIIGGIAMIAIMIFWRKRLQKKQSLLRSRPAGGLPQFGSVPPRPTQPQTTYAPTHPKPPQQQPADEVKEEDPNFTRF